jgi:hypothetical protein
MRQKAPLRSRFWLEAVLGSLAAILAVVTLISHEWIEIVFGVDPDQGSGFLEWGIVVGLALASVLLGLLARAEWRHAAIHTSE